MSFVADLSSSNRMQSITLLMHDIIFDSAHENYERKIKQALSNCRLVGEIWRTTARELVEAIDRAGDDVPLATELVEVRSHLEPRLDRSIDDLSFTIKTATDHVPARLDYSEQLHDALLTENELLNLKKWFESWPSQRTDQPDNALEAGNPLNEEDILKAFA
jgi:hypothetical protein